MNNQPSINLIFLFTIMGLIIAFITSCEKDKKEVPVIIWENPEDIVVGTLLSDSHLNATVNYNVFGTFVYLPPIGTMLNIGSNQVLKVNFTPFNTEVYSSVSKEVRINVIPPTLDSGVSSSVFNDSLIYQTMYDQDGNIYKTITIGTQTWMAENLRTTRFRNGDYIPFVSDSINWINITIGANCIYKNVFNNDELATYGRLYNWHAVSDSRSLAPNGWHVATYDEWKTLITYLGGQSVAGGKLKESGKMHWPEEYNCGTNESGFTALPSGQISNDWVFSKIGYHTLWWTSTEVVSNNTAFVWRLEYFSKSAHYFNNNKNYGYSVRCVKD